MLLLSLLLACGEDGVLFGRGDGDGSGGGGGGVDSDDDDDGSGTDDGVVQPLPSDCSPLAAPSGRTVELGPSDDLAAAVAAAEPFTTFLLADGTYALTGGDAESNLSVRARGVTIRSASGDPAAVVLDGGYATTELVSIDARDVTLAEITVRASYGAAVAVRGASGARIFRVDIVEPGAEAIRVEADGDEAYADDGVIACTTTRRETWCGTSVSLSQAEGWVVRDSALEQPLCPEPALRVADGSRGTVIDRTSLSSLSIALRVGDTDYEAGTPRVHADAECASETAGHYGGAFRNLFVRGGMRLEEACGTSVAHVSVWGGDLAWAFSEGLVVRNVLAAVADGGGAALTGQLRPGGADFVDAATGDLHLADDSAAIGAGVAIDAGLADSDFDGEARPLDAPDIGADQRVAR